MNAVLSAIARVCLAAIFLGSAVGKITDVSGTVDQMRGVGIPLPNVLVFGAIAFLLAGGVSVVLGWFTRVGTALLMVFLTLATYYFHAFWKAPEEQFLSQMIAFQKNLGLFGGLLFLFANGPGLLSVDGRRVVRERVVIEEPTVVSD